MKATQAGIWMDHSHAYLIEFNAKASEPKLIESPINHELKHGFHGESHQHLKEQQELSTYFKELMNTMKAYQEVLLFGPGDAKTELFNTIAKDHKFPRLIIKSEPTDKLTPRQMQAFVRKHFMPE